jgi:CRISPR-associated protein Cas5t
MRSLEVLRVVVEATVTSFRHPHFLIARQPTFEMPPPSTIFGHVASALGELPGRESFRFAYHFESEARASDLEHQHVVYAQGGKFEYRGEKFPKNIEGNVQPQYRDFHFRARLTLYLDRLDWADAFKRPAFCVVLGRSQDLADVVSVERITLEEQPGAYLQGTLLPFSMRPFTAQGSTAMMPRYISAPPERRAEFARYVVLREQLFCGAVDGAVTGSWKYLDQSQRSWLVDPDTRVSRGVKRGLVFHGFMGE